MRNRIFGLIILTLLFGVGLFSLFQTDAQSPYLEKIRLERREKNRAFVMSEESPLTPEMKASFKGLMYFEPDENWVLSGDFLPAPQADTLELAVNTGETEKIILEGVVRFQVAGKVCNLVCFRNPYASDTSLFIPFKDETSGIETYGGGRYLDAVRDKNGAILLDFNQAYNPFCVYNENFSCILPPVENYLKLKVLAGEKLTY